MIKHRFILRSPEEARIFAAIPTERQVLTWGKWYRQPDWATLREELRGRLATAEVIRNRTERVLRAGFCGPAESFNNRLTSWMGTAAREAADTLTVFLRIAEQESEDWIDTMNEFQRTTTDTLRALNNQVRVIAPKYTAEKLLTTEFGEMVAPVSWLHTPTGREVCPEGIPFAYYTVEIPDAVFAVSKEDNSFCKFPRVFTVIEGMAFTYTPLAPSHVVAASTVIGRTWPERDANEAAIIRAVEMVTQMLTERALNQKADTRVIVRETDPAHAIRVRDADTDAHHPEPKMRTIKFEISPPRYLRAAAARILHSNVRAHWVRGHWRNQPYGEGHQLRRDTWIKPHVRGLGEAGPVVSKVASPRMDELPPPGSPRN